MSHWQEKMLMLAQKARPILPREYSPQGLALLFLLALSVGAMTKALLNDSLTIGHDDYLLARPDQIVDLNLLEKSLIRENGMTSDQRAAPKGESCAESGA